MPTPTPDLARVRELAAKRRETILALRTCTRMLEVETLEAYRLGARKTPLARAAGVTRVTLDAWLKKAL